MEQIAQMASCAGLTLLLAYPHVTSRHVAIAAPAGPLGDASTVVLALPLRPSLYIEKLGCREYFFEAHFCGSCSLRPVCSTPCLLSTPSHDDAVGTVFGAEQSNCTGGTLTRVDLRFTGAPILGTDPLPWFIFIATCLFDSLPALHPASRRRSWHGLRCSTV